ncbi:hypothetical protein [Streptomyces sp. NPDC059649]|uniref:hypothetical protein n=1 Tax=Streptomyces sp. NPDC059649 TaxID=3346895 RepID=UPI00367B31D4
MSANESIQLIHGRRMQCKDIPDELYLGAVRDTAAKNIWGNTTNRQMVKEVVEAVVGHVPDNLFDAKSRRLIQRGMLDGCACGCRGDFSIPTDDRVAPDRESPAVV